MRLSEESIKDILDLQKNMLPLVYCCASEERLNSLSRGIIYYNGKVGYKSNKGNEKSRVINTLVIFLDEISEENILDIEKKLISLNKEEVVLLEATGIDLLIHKRNLALSFINRYNINVIKGTMKEIDSLIKIQSDKEDKEGSKFRYREFSRKNDTILIIKGVCYYYITDGYSEFYIKKSNCDFKDKEYLENIYTGMIAVSIGLCKNKSKSEIVKSILISSIAFYMAQANSSNLEKNEFIENKYHGNSNENLLNEIYKIDVDKIRDYGDINYFFKR